MKAFIILVSLCLFAGCKDNKMSYPENPAVSHLISPIYIGRDTVEIALKDYFSFPEKVDKITLSGGLGVSKNKNRQTISLAVTDTSRSFFNIGLRYEGYVYDIPVIRQDRIFVRDSLQIIAHEMKGDTILLRNSGIVSEWMVYWENYKLPDQCLHQDVYQLCFSLPPELSGTKNGRMRVWAVNEKGSSQGILLPFKEGKLVMKIEDLDSLGISMKFWVGKVNQYDITRDLDHKELLDLLKTSVIDDISAGNEVFHADSFENSDSLFFKKRIYNSMALRFGNYIPLRDDRHVYAYMRSYFGLEWIVIFNKGLEMTTLKLDLPYKYRNKDFKSLFGNRFSYGNSKLIADVPAQGIEVIYN